MPSLVVPVSLLMMVKDRLLSVFAVWPQVFDSMFHFRGFMPSVTSRGGEILVVKCPPPCPDVGELLRCRRGSINPRRTKCYCNCLSEYESFRSPQLGSSQFALAGEAHP